MPRNVQVLVKTPKPPATKSAASPSPKIATKAAAPSPRKAPTKVAGKASPLSSPATGKSIKAKPKAKSAVKEVKSVKQKLIRDSFTFPQVEYALLVEMKKNLLAAGIDAKKGELIRAGISMLANLDQAALVKALAAVDKLKAGRPAK